MKTIIERNRFLLILVILTGVMLLITGCTDFKASQPPISSVTSATTAKPNVDPAYIQVSTDPVYEGMAFKVSCFDANHQTVCISNRDASFQISLFNADNKPVDKVKYHGLIINYLPTGIRDNVLWVSFSDFMPFYDGALLTYPYRKFEGSVKMVLILLGHSPLEATNLIRLYVNGAMPVSQKEYEDYVASHGPPPIQPSPEAIDGYPYYFPEIGSNNISISPTFVWDPELMAVGNATSYNFRIYADADNKNLIEYQAGVPNIYKLTVPLEHGQTYYWQTQGMVRGIRQGDWITYDFKTK